MVTPITDDVSKLASASVRHVAENVKFSDGGIK